MNGKGSMGVSCKSHKDEQTGMSVLPSACKKFSDKIASAYEGKSFQFFPGETFSIFGREKVFNFSYKNKSILSW
jgi:hypothetical protein